MKKLKRHVRGLVFVLVFGILCTSNFLVNAKSETVSFSVFDKNAMRFITQRFDGSFYTIEAVSGNTITRLANATRFTNGAEFYTTSQDDGIACLWVYTDPTAVDSPVYTLVGYKGCTVSFSVTYDVTPRCYDSSGNYIADGNTFEFLKDSSAVASYFAFYSRPEWTVYSNCRATAKKIDFIVANSKRTASVVVEYSFTIPSETFNIYGFTSSVGRPNSSGALGLDEQWKPNVVRAYYGFSATFSDFTVDSNDAFAAPDVSGDEASGEIGEIDDITKDYNEQLNIQLDNIRVQWANLWNADFMAGFYVIKEFLDYLFDTKPWNYLVVFSLVLGCTCVALKIAPGIISKTRDVADAARSKNKGGD